ncbi:hypothetical protein BDP55DRAFT_420325 [Colletotrichum godetiae]|uniref:Uncharacterized protein n=1 Tax=Colletotrichum godetiae TaxID=1209918 RepID=A0AAJ0A747_9PEZI|nr:uncharacterized protein BDP55DRAFT_420325 [Colletotrichum godetiae]KAK1657759.1 hypothetical protein BDP55DRAFT_420325 [Colletotrichum godetiae]
MASTKVPFMSGLNQRASYERCGGEVAEDAQDHVNVEDKPKSLMKLQSAFHDGHNCISPADRSAVEVLMQMTTGCVRSPTVFGVDSGTLSSRPAGETVNPSNHAPPPSYDCKLQQQSQNQLPELPSSNVETKSLGVNRVMEPADDSEVPHQTPSPSLGRVIYEGAEKSEIVPVISDPIATDDTDRIREKAHMRDGLIGPFQRLHSQVAWIQHEFTELEQENTRLEKENADLHERNARLKRNADRLERRVKYLKRRKASLKSALTVLQAEKEGPCFVERERSFDICSE